MAPAYLGNMAAPFVKYWKGWNRPISERWLGAHKTVAGFLLGVIVALGTAFLQSAIDWKGSLVDYANWPALGLALGIGALGGDALKSLVKRARGLVEGDPWLRNPAHAELRRALERDYHEAVELAPAG